MTVPSHKFTFFIFDLYVISFSVNGDNVRSNDETLSFSHRVKKKRSFSSDGNNAVSERFWLKQLFIEHLTKQYRLKYDKFCFLPFRRFSSWIPLVWKFFEILFLAKNFQTERISLFPRQIISDTHFSQSTLFSISLQALMLLTTHCVLCLINQIQFSREHLVRWTLFQRHTRIVVPRMPVRQRSHFGRDQHWNDTTAGENVTYDKSLDSASPSPAVCFKDRNN